MKTLRSKILVILVSVMFLCLTLALAFSFNIAKVHATVDSDAFVMEKGASLALTKDGLRFRVQMGKNVYDRIFTNDTDDSVDLSVLIAPKSFFEELNATENAGKYQELSKKIEIQIDDVNKVYEDDGYYYANAVLSNLAVVNNANITKDQFDLDFVAVGCIATTTDSNTAYEYASFFDGDIANNTRSQYQIAHASVLSENDEDASLASEILDRETSPYKTWFGTKDYPINVDSAEEYSILQAKVAAGLTTDANFNVYNKFTSLAGGTIEDRENLPENTTFYHYVSYYDEDTTTLLDKVEVKEGETAVTSVNNEYEQLNYSHNMVYEYYINNWVNVAGTQSVADLSNITENKRVFAYYGRRSVDQTLLAEASAANPDVALFFSERFGFTQLGSAASVTNASHTFSHANKEYHPDMEYDGFKGMTSYTVKNPTADKRMIFTINKAPSFTYNTGDYVMFYVYVELDTASTSVPIALVRCNNDTNSGVWCAPNTWTKVVFPANEFFNESNSHGNFLLSFGAFNCLPTSGNDTYTYYMSNVVRLSGDKVIKLDACTSDCKRTHSSTVIADDATYNIGGGDVTLIGKTQKVVWGSNYTYVGEFGSHVYYVDGKLMYNEIETPINGNTTRQMYMSFAQAVSGKVYIVAKGFGLDATNTQPKMQIFENGTHKATPSGTCIKELDDGFKVWEFDFGDRSIDKVKLFANGAKYNQIVISSISTTNPAA